MRLIAGYAGRVKDFRPIFAKKEDLRAELPKGQQHNSNTHILPHGGEKGNYSVVCRRCNRKLTSEVSRNRGYGSYCWRKTKNEEAKAKQMSMVEFVKEEGK